jgi:hypothetical protein
MPTPYRKPKVLPKPSGTIVVCPGCGHKARAPKTSNTLKCSDCGKVFRPGATGTGRTVLWILLAFVAMAGIAYFAMTRASRNEAEEKAKAAAEERRLNPGGQRP